MSIIQKIRDKSAILIFILIAISLLAFILQDAFVGKSGAGLAENNNMVGSLNGEKISRIEFDNMLDKYIESYKKQGINIPEEYKYMFMQNIWDGLIQTKIGSNEINNSGFVVSQKEFNDLFFGNNIHPAVKQQFTDPKTGEYNEGLVKNYLNQIKKMKDDNQDKIAFLETFVKPVIANELQQKITTLCTKSIYLPSWYKEKLESILYQSSKIKVVAVPYSTISDSLIKIEPKTLLEEATKIEPQLLSKNTQRNASIVTFTIQPTSKDTLIVLNKLKNLKEKIVLSKDKDDKKIFYSNTSSKNKEYLENYLKLNDFKQDDKTVIAKLKVGEIAGPILKNEKYVLYKILDKKDFPDSIKCRHILIGIDGPVKRTDSIAKKLADSMVYFLKKGQQFETLVQKYSDDDGSKKTKGEYSFNYSQYKNLVKEFANAVFLGKTGDKKIIKTSFGYHYVEVLSQSKSNPAYQVGIIEKNIEASKNTIDSIYQIANNFLSKVNTVEQFISEAKNQNLNVTKINVQENDFNSSIGFCRPIVRWIYENKIGAISKTISIKDKIYVVGTNQEYKKGELSSNDISEDLKRKIINQKKAELIVKENNSKNDLFNLAAQYKLEVKDIDSIKFSNSVISNYGMEPKLVAASFQLNSKNKLNYVCGNLGVYYYIIQDVYSTSQPNQIQNDLMKNEQSIKNSIWNDMISYLKVNSKIVDDRAKYY